MDRHALYPLSGDTPISLVVHLENNGKKVLGELLPVHDRSKLQQNNDFELPIPVDIQAVVPATPNLPLVRTNDVD
jgi:hypothetical protein